MNLSFAIFLTIAAIAAVVWDWRGDAKRIDPHSIDSLTRAGARAVISSVLAVIVIAVVWIVYGVTA